MEDDMKYELGQLVKAVVGEEQGTIIGRAEYLTSEPNYYVRYLAADGRMVEAWWAESAIGDAF
jgi:hypothetical protein